MRATILFGFVLFGTWALPACELAQPGRGDIDVLLAQENEGALLAATDRLARYGAGARVPMEAALHGADERGRKNLILAMRRLGHPDAVPLLRHLALYDPAPAVRREAVSALQAWATGSDGRAAKARAALRSIDEATKREEGA